MIAEPLLLALANRQRGAHTTSGVNKPLFGLAVTVVFMLHGVSEPWALLGGLLAWLGYAPSLGEQAGEAAESKKGDFDTDWLTNLLVPKRLHQNPELWARWGLLVRGLYFVPMGLIYSPWLTLFVPFLFLIGYYAGIKFEKHILKRKGWEVGELFFGALLGIAIVAIGESFW